MRHIQINLLAIAAALTVLFVQSCGGRVTGGGPVDIFFPYVEEVVIPQDIRVGKAFQLEIRISAYLDEATLNLDTTYITEQGGADYYIDGRNSGVYNDGGFSSFAIIKNSQGPIPLDSNRRESVIKSHVINQAGLHSIYIPSTRTREQGGSSMAYHISEGGYFVYPPESDLIEYREIVVEVLPAP